MKGLWAYTEVKSLVYSIQCTNIHHRGIFQTALLLARIAVSKKMSLHTKLLDTSKSHNSEQWE